MPSSRGQAAPVDDTSVCHFPGCSRPSRADPSTGRPALYCEQVIDGVAHNRVNAWHRRRSEQGAPVTPSVASNAPVSMARATLEERLAGLPDKLAEFTGYIDGVIAEVRTATDMEAAGAEVEDAHREALARVSEAEHKAAAADRERREAQLRAASAESQRGEADAAAEDALAETVRVRSELERQLADAQRHAQTTIEAAEQRADAAEAGARQATADRDEQVALGRDEVAAARSAAAAADGAREAAERAAQRERDANTALRAQGEQLQRDLDAARAEAGAARASAAAADAGREAAEQASRRDREIAAATQQHLEQARAEARADREALRGEHAEQTRQLREAANERAAALTAALDYARAAGDSYQQQQLKPADTGASGEPSSTPPRRQRPRKSELG